MITLSWLGAWSARFCLPSGTGDVGRSSDAKAHGPGAEFFQRPIGERPGKKSASPWARSVSAGRGLARSGAPARIGRPEGKSSE
jgi:hypothetical protein